MSELVQAEPVTPTGQYPGPVFADGAALSLGDGGEVEVVTPTGQYPGPVFAEGAALSLGDGGEVEVVTPTGQYPGPVFADGAALSLGDDAPEPTLSNSEVFAIVRAVAAGISGEDVYTATEDLGPQHGLGLGLLLFDQASGRLAELFGLMRARESEVFAAAIGPDLDALLATTGAASPAARLGTVAGTALVDPRWRIRLARLGEIPSFRAAQNEMAIERVARPMIGPLTRLGMDTQRALAIGVDRAAALGPDEALAWIVGVAGPLRSPETLARALGLCGFANVAAAQAAFGHAVGGALDPETHCCIVGRLRALDVPVADATQLIASVVAATTGDALARVEALRDDPTLLDLRPGG